MLRLNPAQHPCLTRWQQMSWDERWMRPSEMLLQEVIACYEEHFSLVLEDVLKAKDSRAQLVEGSAVLPDLVAGLLPHVYQGVWIVPNPEFQTFYYSQRSWARKALADCADPETAFANWMERDSQFGFWVAERANQLGLSLLTVNGSQTIAENANWIAEHFKLTRSGENRGK